ncbi:hypothetical protein O3P69_017889 [Scylla paramamosain]|uniref:Uncharacterized protein n=1 Tax=Scylla paramamosain TaxID=85552 RepID=A0AAW0TJW0_SCYPA
MSQLIPEPSATPQSSQRHQNTTNKRITKSITEILNQHLAFVAVRQPFLATTITATASTTTTTSKDLQSANKCQLALIILLTPSTHTLTTRSHPHSSPSRVNMDAVRCVLSPIPITTKFLGCLTAAAPPSSRRRCRHPIATFCCTTTRRRAPPPPHHRGGRGGVWTQLIGASGGGRRVEGDGWRRGPSVPGAGTAGRVRAVKDKGISGKSVEVGGTRGRGTPAGQGGAGRAGPGGWRGPSYVLGGLRLPVVRLVLFNTEPHPGRARSSREREQRAGPGRELQEPATENGVRVTKTEGGARRPPVELERRLATPGGLNAAHPPRWPTPTHPLTHHRPPHPRHYAQHTPPSRPISLLHSQHNNLHYQ